MKTLKFFNRKKEEVLFSDLDYATGVDDDNKKEEDENNDEDNSQEDVETPIYY